MLIRQDVFLENGRCAFAIENLLDFGSRAIFTEEVGKDPKKLEQTIRNFTLDVIEHMDMPKHKPPDVPKNGGNEQSEKPWIKR